MKAENLWTLVFGGIAALTGVIYLYNQRNQSGSAPVYNSFPPLNTPQNALATGYDEPTTTVTQPTTAGQPPNPAQTLTPWPVYGV